MSRRSWLALAAVSLSACDGASAPDGAVTTAALDWLDAPAPDSLARRVSGDGDVVIGTFGS